MLLPNTPRILPSLTLALTLLLVPSLAPAAPQCHSRACRAWRVSVGILATVAVTDTVSSWRGPEANPLLGRQQFGHRAAGIKLGATAGGLLLQHWGMRRAPEYAGVAVGVNSVAAGVLGYATVHNLRVR